MKHQKLRERKLHPDDMPFDEKERQCSLDAIASCLYEEYMDGLRTESSARMAYERTRRRLCQGGEP